MWTLASCTDRGYKHISERLPFFEGWRYGHGPVVLRWVVGALDRRTTRAEIKVDVTRRARNVHIPNIRVAGGIDGRIKGGTKVTVCESDDRYSKRS